MEAMTNGHTDSAPRLEARHVKLRSLRDSDGAFLYALMSDPRAGGRVRFGGATPSPEKVAASLWDNVLAQFVVESVTTGEALGLVAITTPNFRDGFAYVSALAVPELQGKGLLAEATMLAFEYAFRTWPFRKLYLEATDDSYAAFASADGWLFTEEGRLRQHAYWNGRYVDVHILAIYREAWDRLAPRALGPLKRKPRPAESEEREASVAVNASSRT